MTFNHLMDELKTGQYHPVYFLMGEEPYFIDVISDFIAENVLNEEEKAFNQQVLYGRDVKMDQIISSARRFPVMSQRQVVMVKEAQQIGSLEGLDHYLNNPMKSTLLVFCYKHKKLDKRNKITKLIAEKSVLFESDRLRDDKIPEWIQSFLDAKGYKIEPKVNRTTRPWACEWSDDGLDRR